GKNALYVSDMSDREQAVADIVRSAFGHAGQKCSALSQLVLHEEVYNDPTFRAALADATSSLVVGSAWDLASVVTPLIMPPNGLQRDALTRLAEGEQWLVEPRFDPENPRLVSPGIKWGVKPQSAAHTTEYFCPLLSVLCARNLDDALRIANATSYGLTAGIHSLDEREQEQFVSRMQAGNLYVNRPITGAIVQRQPFGGWKASSFGPGAKAGGPNYVGQFTVAVGRRATDLDSIPSEGLSAAHQSTAMVETMSRYLDAADLRRLAAYATACSEAHAAHFQRSRDVSCLRGEDNLMRYLQVEELAVWVGADATAVDVAMVAVAAATCGCRLRWFTSDGVIASAMWDDLVATRVVESELPGSALAEHLASHTTPRLRVLGVGSESITRLANQHDVAVIDGPPSA